MSLTGGFYDGINSGQGYAPQYVATANLSPLFAGLVLQFFFAGLAFGNFGRYLSTPTYASDSRAHRILVWAVMTSLALVTGLCVASCMLHALGQDRSIDAIFAMTVPDGVGPTMAGVVAALVQGLLLVRAAKLLRDNRIRRAAFLAVGFLAILISFLAGVAQTVANLSLVYDFWPKMGPFTFSATAAINLWTSAALDLFLSTTLILALRKHVLGFNRATDSVIRRLMRTAATTASYTAVFSTIAAALSVARPASALTGATNFVAFSIPGASLYALSLLATLAARKPPAPNGGVINLSAALAAADPAARARPRAAPVADKLGRHVSCSVPALGAFGRSESRPVGGEVEVKTETEVVMDAGTGEDAGERRRTDGRYPGERVGVAEPTGERRRKPSVQLVQVPGAT